MTETVKVYTELQKDGTTKYFVRKRRFLGKTEDFATKEEQAFEKRHLKAFLKGHDQFRYKYKDGKAGRVPAWYEVMKGVVVQEITKEEVDTINLKHKRVSIIPQVVQQEA